jgi:hypothetical protein
LVYTQDMKKKGHFLFSSTFWHIDLLLYWKHKKKGKKICFIYFSIFYKPFLWPMNSWNEELSSRISYYAKENRILKYFKKIKVRIGRMQGLMKMTELSPFLFATHTHIHTTLHTYTFS